MHRQAVLMEQERMAVQDGFISRFGSLPVVNSAWTQACGMYQKTKERNSLLRATCNLAEGGVKTIASTTMPLVVKCQPQIDQMNAYACQQLARMEETYPVITHKPEEVLKEGKEKCSALLKPVTDRVTTVHDTYTGVVSKSKETVEAAKNVVPNTISKVKDYGISQINRTMETQYGKFVNEKVKDALTLSEEYVEKYLPESESESDDDEEEKDKQEEEGVIARVTSLSGKVRHRMYRRAMKDLRGLQVRSQETLSMLNFTVDLIQYAKTNISETKSSLGERYATAQKKVVDTWSEVMVDDEEEEDEDGETPQTFERKAIISARKLTRQVRHSVTVVTGYLPEQFQPGAVKERLHNAKQYSEDLYQSFKQARGFEDVPSVLLNQAKEKMGYLQETLTFLMDTFLVSPVGWLIPVRRPVEPSAGDHPSPTDMDNDNTE